MILIQTRSQMTVILAVKRRRFCVTFVLWSTIYKLTSNLYSIYYILCIDVWHAWLYPTHPFPRLLDVAKTQGSTYRFRFCTLKFVYSCSWGSFWVDPAEFWVKKQILTSTYKNKQVGNLCNSCAWTLGEWSRGQAWGPLGCDKDRSHVIDVPRCRVTVVVKPPLGGLVGWVFKFQKWSTSTCWNHFGWW